MSWATPILHAVGDVLSSSDWNITSNDLTFLYNRTQGGRGLISYVNGTAYQLTFPVPFPTSCDSFQLNADSSSVILQATPTTVTNSNVTFRLYGTVGEAGTNSYFVDWIAIGH